MDHAARAQSPPKLALRRADYRPETDRPHDGRELDVAEFTFVAQMAGKVRRSLNVVAQAVRCDVGEWLADAGCPVDLVGDWDRHAGFGHPCADDATRPGEVHRARPRIAILEHRVLLAESEVPEIDPGIPQPERIGPA